MMSLQPDRRQAVDQRVRRLALHYPERRTGFDRRAPSAGTLNAAYHRQLERYRGSPAALAGVLTALVALNLTDFIFTIQALELGAVEANPFMAWLLDASPAAAGVLKMTAAGAIAGAMWLLRSYRRVLEASVVFVTALGALMIYQVWTLLVRV